MTQSPEDVNTVTLELDATEMKLITDLLRSLRQVTLESTPTTEEEMAKCDWTMELTTRILNKVVAAVAPKVLMAGGIKALVEIIRRAAERRHHIIIMTDADGTEFAQPELPLDERDLQA
jgi:hypothetical protein